MLKRVQGRLMRIHEAPEVFQRFLGDFRSVPRGFKCFLEHSWELQRCSKERSRGFLGVFRGVSWCCRDVQSVSMGFRGFQEHSKGVLVVSGAFKKVAS